MQCVLGRECVWSKGDVDSTRQVVDLLQLRCCTCIARFSWAMLCSCLKAAAAAPVCKIFILARLQSCQEDIRWSQDSVCRCSMSAAAAAELYVPFNDCVTAPADWQLQILLRLSMMQWLLRSTSTLAYMPFALRDVCIRTALQVAVHSGGARFVCFMVRRLRVHMETTCYYSSFVVYLAALLSGTGKRTSRRSFCLHALATFDCSPNSVVCSGI